MVHGNSRSMFSVFMDMLKSVGGQFSAYKDEPVAKREKVWEPRVRIVARPVNKGYVRDAHGSLRRETPKLNKGVGGRQRKRLARLARESSPSKFAADEGGR